MREPARDRGRLEDMLHAAEYVISFMEGLTLQSFTEDKLRYFAVLKDDVPKLLQQIHELLGG